MNFKGLSCEDLCLSLALLMGVTLEASYQCLRLLTTPVATEQRRDVLPDLYIAQIVGL